MDKQPRRLNLMPIVISLLLALMLSIIPIPGMTVWLRPAWLVLVLIYWGVCLPGKIGIVHAWLLGLIQDILLVSLLGEHALAIAVTVYVASKMERQLNFFPLWQQSLCIGILIGIYQLVIVVVQGLSGQLHSHYFYLPVLSSMCIWPWLTLILRTYSRRYHLNKAQI